MSRPVVVAVLAIGILVGAVSPVGASGDFDPTYSDDGKGKGPYLTSFAPDGRMLGAAGGFLEPFVTVRRYRRSGAIDRSFSGDGTARVSFGGPGLSYGAVANDDGKVFVLAAAPSRPTRGYLAVARLRVNGSLDTSFAGGIARILSVDALNAAIVLRDIQPTTDGGIAIVAQVQVDTTTTRYVAVRLTDSGIPNRRFSGDGLLPLPSNFAAASFSPDGRLAILTRAGRAIIIQRRTPTGAVDKRFSDDGKTRMSGCDFVSAFDYDGPYVEFGPSGRMFVACLRARQQDLAIRRYLPSGVLDAEFSGDGVAYGLCCKIAVDPSGGVIVLNSTSTSSTVTRINRRGLIDRSFADAGTRILLGVTIDRVVAVSDRVYLADGNRLFVLTN